MTPATVFCEQCRARMETDSQFCEACGAQVAAIVRSVVQAECPKCMQPDQCSLAAEFLKREIPAEKRGKDELDSEIVRDLLAPPEKPELPSRLGWALVPLVPGVNAIAMWFAPMHKYYKLVMLALAVWFVYCVSVTALYLDSAYILPGLLIVLVYYSGLIFDRKRQRAEFEKRSLPKHGRMAANWKSLYYCERCGGVWLRDTPAKFVPVEDTNELLAG
jgi:hypothetical protein